MHEFQQGNSIEEVDKKAVKYNICLVSMYKTHNN